MYILQNVFLKLIEMSLMASCCVLVICVIRLFLKKAPKIYSYLLWSIVALRLICPVGVESSFSLFNLPGIQNTFDVVLPDNMMFTSSTVTNGEGPELFPDGNTHIDMTIPVQNVSNPGETIPTDPPAEFVVDNNTGANLSTKDSSTQSHPLVILSYIWLGGVLSLLLYSILQYHHLSNKLHRNAVPVASAYLGKKAIPVWESEALATPFIMGIFKPRILLPTHLAEAEKKYVLSHECTHIRRKDYLIKQFAYFLTCVYWFNPVIWFAYFLMAKDMEMSCDETVLGMGELNIRKDYSNTLLTLASEHYRFGGSPLAFGENNITPRIKNIMNYKKPAFWVTIVCLLALVLGSAIMITNPKSTVEEDETINNNSTEESISNDESNVESDVTANIETDSNENIAENNIQNPDDTPSELNLQAEVDNFPQLIPGINWGMSIEEIAHVLGINVDDFQKLERFEWNAPFYSMYEVQGQSWNEHPVTFHFAISPIAFREEELGLIGIAIIRNDLDPYSPDTEEIDAFDEEIREIYGKEMLPKQKSMQDSYVLFDSEKLPWYNTEIQGILTEYYKNVWNDLQDLEDVAATDQNEWAQGQSKIYMNLRRPVGNNVNAMAFSAAVLNHMLESGDILTDQNEPTSVSQEHNPYPLMGKVIDKSTLYHSPNDSADLRTHLTADTIVEITAIGDGVFKESNQKGVPTTSIDECRSFAKIYYMDANQNVTSGYVRADTLNLDISENTEDTFKYWIGKAWCEAFSIKDGDMLQSMLHDKSAFQNLGWKNDNGTIQIQMPDTSKGQDYDHTDAWPSRYFQLSIPPYTIDDTDSGRKADVGIYYYAECSEPTAVVWRQELFVQKGQLENISRIEELFQDTVDATPLRHYNEINSYDDFTDAYITAYGPVYFNYEKNGYLDVYSDIDYAKNKLYEMSAADAAQQYLHLAPATTHYTMDYIGVTNEPTDENEQTVLLVYTLKDGKPINIPMYYREDLGIWCIDRQKVVLNLDLNDFPGTDRTQYEKFVTQ